MKKIVGRCRICGQNKELTFEHVPPKSAFNSSPIRIQEYEHLVNSGSPLYGKSKRSNKGFGQYTLCQSCNNSTGQWYAKDFAQFVKQGMDILTNSDKKSRWIFGTYDIKPLNVLKQIMVMFMVADKSDFLLSDRNLSEYILEKENTALPSRYKVFIYSNYSSRKRMFGIMASMKIGAGIQTWSEISFEPFGYMLAVDSESAHPNMLDITGFSQYDYGHNLPISMRTYFLNTDKPIIGYYE